MHDTKSTTVKNHPRATGPMRVSRDRRQRSRLRELCDEVLASFRAAQSRELISERELSESRAMLATITPALPR